MFEINKAEFGSFVASLRKEKDMTQKDLAERLFVSDKAVSKWERGLSIPDTAILVPLADVLGISVTELLQCRRSSQDGTAESIQVEKEIPELEEGREHRFSSRWKRGLLLIVCAGIGVLEICGLTLLGYSADQLAISLSVFMILMLVFGLYFCVFAKETLPEYYDKHRISMISDGVFRMNIPGIYFNNRNWSYILRSGQLWAMIGLISLPIVFLTLDFVLPEKMNYMKTFILLLMVLGGLFIPMIWLGKKYESESEQKKQPQRGWIAVICAVLITGILLAVLGSGITSSGSGVRMGWVEQSGRNRWSASYAFHDGYRQRIIDAEDVAILEVSIVSQSGEIGMTITDENGETIYDQHRIETSLFRISIKGRVTVRITGEEHKGSFSLSW